MDEVYELAGGGSSLILRVRPRSVPEVVYWGPRVEVGAPELQILDRPVPQAQFDDGEVLSLLPLGDAGFTGHPALIVNRPGRPGPFLLQCREVKSGRGTLDFYLEDSQAILAIRIHLEIDPGTGVLSAQTKITNTGNLALVIDWLSALTLPFDDDEIMLFDGRWTREFNPVRQRLESGMVVKENRTGRTSHHAPPFLIVGSPGFGEQRGHVTGLHLGWSGNSRIFAERLRDGRIQVQAGILHLPGEGKLAPGASYETPVCYAARSGEGLNGLSDRFHPYVRGKIMGHRLAGRSRPVHFNSWEAVYFDHQPAVLTELVGLAAQAGAERFVLDDGWFKGRRHDRAGLGDWTPDPVAYPNGLGPLITQVKDKGMSFGLWIEPEMVNADSDLFRAHPDWILGDPVIPQPLGRGQYMLDLSRVEVRDHLFSVIHTLLTGNEISYLKWDMNRDASHPYSGGQAAGLSYVEGFYQLLARVRDAHPKVEIESCASGGGRADYGVLKYCDRIWTSDCNDPIERQAIQQGFSIFFPPEVMGAHVGPKSAHTTARSASLEMRAITALFGHMGIEGDLRRFRPEERADLARWTSFYKRHRAAFHRARLIRLETGPDSIAFMVDDGGIHVSFAQIATPRHALLPPLRLTGLRPHDLYGVRLINPAKRPEASMKKIPPLLTGQLISVPGALLMEAGLVLPPLRAGEVVLFEIQPLSKEKL